MQRWTDHVKSITGRKPTFVPGETIDLTVDDVELRDRHDPFGPGRSLDVDIPLHLIEGGRDNSDANQWVAHVDR